MNWSKFLPSEDKHRIDSAERRLVAFLNMRGLYWIEVMNLLISEGGTIREILYSVREWITHVRFFHGSLIPLHTLLTFSSKNPDAFQYMDNKNELLPLIMDILEFGDQFTTDHMTTLRKSTPHLYISHLATWPHTSGPVHDWKCSFRGLPKISRSLDPDVVQVTISPDPSDVRVSSPTGLIQDRGRVSSVAFMDGDREIISGHYDGYVQVWDSRTGALQKFLKCHSNGQAVTSVALISLDQQQHIVTASLDNSIRIWSMKSWKRMYILKGHTDAVFSVATAKQRPRIVSGGADNTVRIWDFASYAWPHKVLAGHTDEVQSVAISADGNTVVSGSSDATVRIWDAASGEVVHTLRGHHDAVNSVSMFPDSNDGSSRRVASGSDEGSVFVWSMDTGAELMHLDGESTGVYGTAVSPDGNTIATANDDKLIRIFDLSAQRGGSDAPKQTLYGHSTAVCSVAFSNDGTKVASSDYDGSLRVWDVSGTTKSVILTKPQEPLDDEQWLSSIDPKCFEWKIQKDGWVVSTESDDRRLMWVDLWKHRLNSPENILTISPEPYFSLDLSKSLSILNDNWTDCYQPDS